MGKKRVRSYLTGCFDGFKLVVYRDKSIRDSCKKCVCIEPERECSVIYSNDRRTGGKSTLSQFPNLFIFQNVQEKCRYYTTIKIIFRL